MRVDEHTFDLDDSPVYYRSADAPGMPKLYLHGIPTSSDDWVDFLARTGGLAPDLIGFGRSGKGGHLDYTRAGLARFLERFLEHVGIDDGIDIVGHDWGAMVALAFVRRQPGRVRRLILLNPPPLPARSGDLGRTAWPRMFRLWRTRGVGELVMGSTTKSLLARALRRGSVRPDAWPDARIDSVWSQFDQGTQRAILRLVRSERDDVVGGGGPRATVGTAGQAPGQAAGQLGPPITTIIWGEEDPWYPPAVADAYAARLPGATVERIAGAGHWPWLDRPEVVDRVAALLEG